MVSLNIFTIQPFIWLWKLQTHCIHLSTRPIISESNTFIQFSLTALLLPSGSKFYSLNLYFFTLDNINSQVRKTDPYKVYYRPSGVRVGKGGRTFISRNKQKHLFYISFVTNIKTKLVSIKTNRLKKRCCRALVLIGKLNSNF